MAAGSRRPVIGITTYPQNDRGRYELPDEYVLKHMHHSRRKPLLERPSCQVADWKAGHKKDCARYKREAEEKRQEEAAGDGAAGGGGGGDDNGATGGGSGGGGGGDGSSNNNKRKGKKKGKKKGGRR